jgi:hypothetical protein
MTLPVKNPAAHPLFMVYLNEKLETNVIEVFPDFSFYDQSNSDYPYTMDWIFFAYCEPNEKFFPIDFIYHSYRGKELVPFYQVGDQRLTQRFQLHLDAPLYAKNSQLSADLFLTPLELHACKNIAIDVNMITPSMFRQANSNLVVFLRQGTTLNY